jgi:hypothetical protein
VRFFPLSHHAASCEEWRELVLHYDRNPVDGFGVNVDY